MKLALSALFAFALAAGNTGCCLFPCGPLLHGCRGFDDGGGCEDGGCDLGGCGGGCGCQADGYPAARRGCAAMGCSRRLHIFNWSRCRDCCDQCGQWTGTGIVSQQGGWPGRGSVNAPANFDEAAPEMTTAGEMVPGSMRVTTQNVEEESLNEPEEPMAVRRPNPIPAPPRPAKRISSSKK